MEKLNLNKLIANDIVNYGMDKTTSFNYIVSLNDFLDDYDDESRDYIKSHQQDILNAYKTIDSMQNFQQNDTMTYQERNKTYTINGDPQNNPSRHGNIDDLVAGNNIIKTIGGFLNG